MDGDYCPDGGSLSPAIRELYRNIGGSTLNAGFGADDLRLIVSLNRDQVEAYLPAQQSRTW